jgi:hypothetical protein
MFRYAITEDQGELKLILVSGGMRLAGRMVLPESHKTTNSRSRSCYGGGFIGGGFGLAGLGTGIAAAGALNAFTVRHTECSSLSARSSFLMGPDAILDLSRPSSRALPTLFFGNWMAA